MVTLETHPAGRKALAQFEKDLGVKVLLITSHTYDADFSGTDLIMRSKQVKVPADLKGLKIRTSSTPVEINLLKAYGANPTPVQYGQLYTALQQAWSTATPRPRCRPWRPSSCTRSPSTTRPSVSG